MPPTDDDATGPSLAERELLRTRTLRYAKREKTRAGVELRALTFVRGKSTYAISIETLLEVRAWPKLCVIPGASAVVPGVFHYRGELLSAHDPSRFMGLESTTSPQWMLVLEHDGERIGLIADEVLGIRSIVEDSVQPVPVTFGDRGACFVGAVEPELLILDAASLFATPDFFMAF